MNKLPRWWLETIPEGRTTPIRTEEVNLECTCPNALASHFCMTGHMTECHVGKSCKEARCGHYQMALYAERALYAVDE